MFFAMKSFLIKLLWVKIDLWATSSGLAGLRLLVNTVANGSLLLLEFLIDGN